MKIYFKNKGKNEDVFTHIKAGRIYYHHICTAENIRGNHLGKRRMILFYGKMKENMDTKNLTASSQGDSSERLQRGQGSSSGNQVKSGSLGSCSLRAHKILRLLFP